MGFITGLIDLQADYWTEYYNMLAILGGQTSGIWQFFYGL